MYIYIHRYIRDMWEDQLTLPTVIAPAEVAISPPESFPTDAGEITLNFVLQLCAKRNTAHDLAQRPDMFRHPENCFFL